MSEFSKRNEQMMSSLEIARLSGKSHRHVLEDVRKQASLHNIDYNVCQHKNLQNKFQPYYEIPIELVGIINMRYGCQQITEACGQIYVSEKRRGEISFREALSSILEFFSISMEAQYYLNGFYIDFYIPEYKIAIEYDEKQHKAATHIFRDMQRQEYLQNILKCKFVRISENDNIYENLGKILRHILRKR